MQSHEMITIAGVRHRYEDASRLGLVDSDGKPTAKAREVTKRGPRPLSMARTAANKPRTADGDKAPAGNGNGDAAPAKSAAKPEWVEYARRQGAPEAELDGEDALTKDALIEKYGPKGDG